jgi:hypothetical protein
MAWLWAELGMCGCGDGLVMLFPGLGMGYAVLGMTISVYWLSWAWAAFGKGWDGNDLSSA